MRLSNLLITLARRAIFFLTLFFTAIGIFAQDGFSLRGVVVDTSGSPIAYAVVSSPALTRPVSVTSSGEFSLRLSGVDTASLHVSALGYEPFDTLVLSGNGEIFLRIALREELVRIEDVSVVGSRSRMVTVERIDVSRVLQLPSSAGGLEALLKTFPGVHASNELSVQYSVRGGSFDENLVYIDGIEVYRPSLVRAGNQEGMSIINPDMVSSVEFSAGAFPARYGDRMSSALNIVYREPSRFRARLDASLLENRAYLEGHLPSANLGAMLGVRYKSTRLLLNTTDTKGDYRPDFLDIQGKLSYRPHGDVRLSFLGGFSRNQYHFKPTKKTTQIGTGLGTFLLMNVYYEGQERDLYSTGFASFSTRWQPIDPLTLNLTLGLYRTVEQETFDILAEYWLDDLKDDSAPVVVNDSVANVGIGGTFGHARNYFNATVFSSSLIASYQLGEHLLEGGVEASRRKLSHNLSEWHVVDSAGYTLPFRELPFDVSGTIFDCRGLQTHRFSSYLQSILKFRFPSVQLSLVAGARLSAREQLDAIRLSPRISLSVTPVELPTLSLYLAGGYYYQYPFYREMRNRQGLLYPHLKPQKAIHAVVGSQWSFLLASRPFRLQTELYYKRQFDLIPYTVTNVSLHYEATNAAEGRVAGLDLKLNGELVSGVESWISLSLMKADMRLTSSLQGELLTPAQQSYFPSPADQRFAGSLFLQDYFPGFPSFRVHLAGHYATGLPFTPPGASYGTVARLPAYKRIDIGFSKVFKEKGYSVSWLREARWLRELTLSAEVLNLLNFANTISYMWIVVPMQGAGLGQLAVPNYLTARCVNVRLIASF